MGRNPPRTVKLAPMVLALPPPMPVVPSDRAVAEARAYAVHRQGRGAVALVRSPRRPRGTASARSYHAASVIKAMLLVAELERRGERPLTRTERKLLEPMIRRSSNTA